MGQQAEMLLFFFSLLTERIGFIRLLNLALPGQSPTRQRPNKHTN